MHFAASHLVFCSESFFFSHNIYNKSTRNSSITLCPPFLIRGQVLVFDGSRMFLQTERYHLPLLLQSFGVKWRHLGSIRKCLFCIALSCPSTISSESVRMYWPYRRNKSSIRRWTLCVCSDQKPMFSVMLKRQFCLFLQLLLNELIWTVSHLVIVDEVEVLERWNHIFLLHTCDFTDLTRG